jgi:hypothetical protein
VWIEAGLATPCRFVVTLARGAGNESKSLHEQVNNVVARDGAKNV